MLRKYLQTTFSACFVHQESTEAMILALLDIPASVFTLTEFLDHHDEQTFSSLLHSKTLEVSLGVLCEKAESPRK